jgi:hypothetical protein
MHSLSSESYRQRVEDEFFSRVRRQDVRCTDLYPVCMLYARRTFYSEAVSMQHSLFTDQTSTSHAA